MRPLLLSALFISLCLCAAESCKKPGGGQVTSGGGTGGNTTLFIEPEHHGYLLDSCTIYIKYGTLDAPADGVYDDSQKCTLQVPPEDTVPAASFAGLKVGVYYLFAQGFHPGYGPVKGGVSWTISTDNTMATDTISLQTSTF